MKLSKREEFMLWRLLEFPIVRFLLSIKRSGTERAERHMEIAQTLWEVRHIKTAFCEDFSEWMKVHDLIAREITDNLPDTIGFDMTADQQDWDIFADRMFKKLLTLSY